MSIERCTGNKKRISTTLNAAADGSFTSIAGTVKKRRVKKRKEYTATAVEDDADTGLP